MAAPSNRYRSNGAIENTYLEFLAREREATQKATKEKTPSAASSEKDSKTIDRGDSE